MSKAIKAFGAAVLEESGKAMFGMEHVTRLCLTALYTGGHVLLEGNPGLGKTELVKTLGALLRLPFGRIQFTPDLMPADITGTYMPDLENRSRLSFREGPVFTSLLLADEINRATPKTQSAMLEAMAERQVTVLGERRKLNQPFMVLATQNPIDHEGTYTLPEAQADRFMFKIEMPVPDATTLRRIMAKQAGAIASVQAETQNPGSTASLLPKDEQDSRAKYEELQRRVRAVAPLPSLEAHITNMFLASNRRFDALQGLEAQQTKRLRDITSDLVRYGLGPRAAIALLLGAKAWTLLFSSHSEQADGPALAKILVPALRHRFQLHFGWQDRYAPGSAQSEFDLQDRLLVEFAQLCAPRANEYQRTFVANLPETLRPANTK